LKILEIDNLNVLFSPESALTCVYRPGSAQTSGYGKSTALPGSLGEFISHE